MAKKTLGFALGAGGSRGVAHIGFLQAMENAGIKPDYISGCSMGSVIGAAYAAGMPLEDIKRAVFGLRILDLIQPTKERGGLLDTKKVRKLLEKYMGDISFSQLNIPFTCIAADMVEQKIVEFSKGKVLDGVVASSSIPAVFKPTEKDGMRLVDGGILERVPYRYVKAMGADVVVAVDVLGWRDCSQKMPTTIGILAETVDMMDNIQTKIKKERDVGIYDFWLEPNLGNMSQYSLSQIHMAYDKGLEIGEEYAKRIKRKISINSVKGNTKSTL